MTIQSLPAIHIQCAIESLIHAHALANMYTINGRSETAKSTLGWFERIERSIKEAREALEEATT
jgi:hypothetical protein